MTSTKTMMLMMAAVACHVIALSHAWYLEGDETASAPNPPSDGGDYSSALEEMASDEEDQAAVAPQSAGACSKEKLIGLFGQLLVSEYNREHEIASGNLFVIASDIWDQCTASSNLCAVYFNVSPTRCIPTSQDPTICNVIISSEGKRRCHATVDLVEGVVRNPLACQLSRGESSSSGSSRQLARLLASMVSDKQQQQTQKRWGQMHGHVHPF